MIRYWLRYEGWIWTQLATPSTLDTCVAFAFKLNASLELAHGGLVLWSAEATSTRILTRLRAIEVAMRICQTLFRVPHLRCPAHYDVLFCRGRLDRWLPQTPFAFGLRVLGLPLTQTRVYRRLLWRGRAYVKIVPSLPLYV